jgi:hypothetical protein
VGIYGGFAGGETARSQRNWKTHPTILSGDVGVPGVASDNSYRVVVGARSATLDGFTITAGGEYSGAGMFISNCSPTVANCVFTHNNGSDGAAMYIYNGAAPTVINCSFTSNTATGKAAVWHRSGGASTFTNCTFSSNMGVYGGAMNSEVGSPVLFNCTFSSNTATAVGGAIYNTSNSVTTVNNCILWGNKAPAGAEGLKTTSGTITFKRCDIKGSGGSGTAWKKALGSDGGGNIDADPHFRNPAQPAGADGIWQSSDDGWALLSGSPCINAGLATAAPAVDILGAARDSAPDIGAYEYQSVGPTAPQGEIAITYRITKPSTAGSQTVTYTYRWTSTGGDSITHGPTTATSDTLTEMNLVQPGEIWTVTVTPSAGGTNGPAASAKVKIMNPENGAAVWIMYR